MSPDAHKLPPAICLMGPTASGKTRVAVELVSRFPCEIISVDSALVFRGMDVGTGKPDALTLARAPHRLIDILDPAESYSAARFRNDALRAMAEITARGKVPLLVGGTMLYFKALKEGLASLPPADARVREEIAALARQQGWEAVHQRLQRLDPQAAQRIAPTDPQRLQRALEVYELTGQPLSQLHARDQARRAGENALPFRLHQIAICPAQRSTLHEHIQIRFEQMLEAGFVDEVRRLKRRSNLSPSLPAIRSVGYRQIWDYLEGGCDFATMREKALAATRQLAKRQLTWLRGWPDLEIIDSEAADLEGKCLKSIAAATNY